jgi:hypothetical protein
MDDRAAAIKILSFQLLINYIQHLLALVERAADGAATPSAALTTTRKDLSSWLIGSLLSR